MVNPWFTSVLSTELLYRQMRRNPNIQDQGIVGCSRINLRRQSALIRSPGRF